MKLDIIIVILCTVRASYVFAEKNRDVNAAQSWLDSYGMEASKRQHDLMVAMWNYEIDITDANEKLTVDENLKLAAFQKQAAYNASQFAWETFPDLRMRREFSKISSNIGPNALKNETKLARLTELQAELTGIYSKGTVFITSKNETLNLEPGLTQILATSRNYEELKEAWKGWRDNTGKHMKDLYTEFIELSNEGVQEVGFKDTGEYWRSWYESDTFQQDLQDLLDELQPLYAHLHHYVKKKLMDIYGKDMFPDSGHIPAHLLGNMWAQQWNNIYEIIEPYQNKARIDVTDEMKRQNYTVQRMFETAEEFFTSLGLEPMFETFWNRSMFKRPEGRKVVCHASAEDFSNQQDFRIKMCTNINMEDLVTIHHEMGHIEYFMQYRNQPIIFRDGANPGFHEAIGDTMALSVSTPAHLKKIKLLQTVVEDHEADINFLMKMALEKVAFLPFGYLIDQWRWSAFSGETPPEKFNDKWWELRCKFQGIAPPVVRTNSDFDPGAKFHIPNNTPYIRYFVSFVTQFQFHEALCEAAHQTGPLHRCDIYQSKEAGKKFMDMLKLGSSKPWPDVMNMLTGQRKMKAASLLKYFKPLLTWLEEQNKGEDLKWNDACPKSTNIDEAMEFLHQYNESAVWNSYYDNVAYWTYETNITEENKDNQIRANLISATFNQQSAEDASRFAWRNFSDVTVKRQFSKIVDIGTSAMTNQTKLKRLREVVADMQAIYSKGQVCLNESGCIHLEPGLTRLMASSRNYDKLLEAWEKWRYNTGRNMKDLYAEFVDLSNEAVSYLGYKDTGEYWRSDYESETFAEDLQDLLAQLQPLYGELHTYVRRKLMEVYGHDKFPASGHIPAHLLGNMWAQDFTNIYDILEPFHNKTRPDITPELQKDYNVTAMFRLAEKFFVSLNLEPMTDYFWDYSMIERPSDGRQVVCHASAWDFSRRDDVRIKMCTDKTMNDLITIHHEMGHVQYYLQYKDQPISFRSGANPGFHEAIGDTMALSVSTPKHLRTINILKSHTDDYESDINYLMKMALEKIAFLPFGYLIDQWRWSVFSGETGPDDYNNKWWQLRCKYQGVSPPSYRSNFTNFDPGAKFHIPSNYPYIRYFVSFVIQFQFHEALCEAANQTGPLYKCDIFNSKEAGHLLQQMLKLGSSKPWPEVMEVITKQRKMNVSSLLSYFEPLINWLKDQNKGKEHSWSDECPNHEDEKHFLEKYDKQSQEVFYTDTVAAWNHATNLTDYNQELATNASLVSSEFVKNMAEEANKLHWKDLKNTTMKRMFHGITDIGTSALKDKTKLKLMADLASGMESIYSKAEVCIHNNETCMEIEPAEPVKMGISGLTRLFSESRNYDDLTAAWKGWRDATGKKMRGKYRQFVALMNEGVRVQNYHDVGEYWRSWYETPTFQQDLENLLYQLKPFYEQVHAYVRKILMKQYGEKHFPVTGHIPAQLLGNMWAQDWGGIYSLVEPFKGKASLDVTKAMKEQKYNVTRMFKTAEEFYLSLGLRKMPDSFWKMSMLEKPEDRDVVCHASAWDFYNGKDFRIKMCTDVTMSDLVTIHHEMGHIQYYLQYKDQPMIFRGGANPGFHEAVGDVMALSVATPGHLKKIGLLDEVQDDEEADINFLMKMALDKVVFYPFGYLIDQWRWSVFSGDTLPNEYNKKWWDLRCKFQGISPAVPRSDITGDFDPGAKYHVPANTPYIRYFISNIIQFHFQKALCQAANQTGPLYKCDIYRSKEAGKLLSNMLQLGSSKPWPDAMEQITGQRKIDAGAVLEYFAPLIRWLEKENFNERRGWTTACPSDSQLQRVEPTVKPSLTPTCRDVAGANFNTLSLTLLLFALLMTLKVLP